MRPNRYDAIVVGVGGAGSAVTARLAARGVDVLGLERFDVPNRRGGPRGPRPVHLPDPDAPAAVPLAERALELWDDLEADHDRPLRYRTGSVHAAPPGDDALEGVRRACESHDLAHETLTGAELGERFPGYDLPDAHEAVYRPDGGFLVPERCTVAHVNRAHDHGATIRARERVTDWRPLEDGVRVFTDHDEYRADRLVVTAGAWTARFVDELEGVAVPERQVRAWLHPEEPDRFAPDRFPAFDVRVPDGRYYGAPVFRAPGFSFGRFHHRETAVDPDEMGRQPMPADERLLREFAETYFPAGAGEVMRLEPCLFTNTPDGEFVVDALPEHPQVVVGAGFSGRGFTYLPAIAEIIADLALEGDTDHDVERFSIDRF